MGALRDAKRLYEQMDVVSILQRGLQRQFFVSVDLGAARARRKRQSQRGTPGANRHRVNSQMHFAPRLLSFNTSIVA